MGSLGYDKYVVLDNNNNNNNNNNNKINHEELDDLESSKVAAAVKRLFAICENEIVFSSDDEFDRLLKRYPSAARTLKPCVSSFVSSRDPAWACEKYPLHVACHNNAPISVIRALIKAWPGALQTEADGCLPLHEACICAKSLPTIQLLVETWPESIKQVTSDGLHYGYGCVPLQLALERFEVSSDIIQFLVEQWPQSLQMESQFLLDMWPESVQQKSPNNAETFLLQALQCTPMNEEIISLLIGQWPESVQIPDKSGNLPLHRALMRRASSAVLSLLLETYPDALEIPNGRGSLPVHMALMHGAPLAVIHSMMQTFPDSLRIPDVDGYCLLHHVLSSRRHGWDATDYLQFITLLVESSPDLLQVQTWSGYLPLHLALKLGRKFTNLIWYIFKLYPEAVLVRVPDGDGDSPLQKALEWRAPLDVIRLMVSISPDLVQVPNRNGSLPLHLALGWFRQPGDAADYLQIIKLLVSYWPDSITIKTRSGMLPLHLACNLCRAYTDIIWYILDLYPQAVRVQDDKSRLPLHIICARKTVAKKVIQRLVHAWPASIYTAYQASRANHPFINDENGRDNSDTDSIFDLENKYSADDCDSDDDDWGQGNFEQNEDFEDDGSEHEDAFTLKQDEDLDDSYYQENDDGVCNQNEDDDELNGFLLKNIHALPLDVACATRERPSLEFLLLLTNGKSPLHFLCKYSRTPWIPTRMNAIKYVASILPNDVMRFYHGMLPFHWVCRLGEPCSVLEWWCEQYPAVIHARTTHTQDLPLHCYLSSLG